MIIKIEVEIDTERDREDFLELLEVLEKAKQHFKGEVNDSKRKWKNNNTRKG